MNKPARRSDGLLLAYELKQTNLPKLRRQFPGLPEEIAGALAVFGSAAAKKGDGALAAESSEMGTESDRLAPRQGISQVLYGVIPSPKRHGQQPE
jgi:hypothetical protein